MAKNQEQKNRVNEPLSQRSIIPVSYPCAILYLADTGKLNGFKNTMAEDDFYTAADDHMWYAAQAKEFLEKQGVEVVDTQQEMVTIQGQDGKKVIIRTPPDYWSALYFYDGLNPPVPVELTMVEEEYRKFMKK